MGLIEQARRARCGVRAADRVHYCYRPSALPCPLASPLRPSLSLHSAAVRFFAISLTTAILPRVRGPVRATGILHFFRMLECGFDR